MENGRILNDIGLNIDHTFDRCTAMHVNDIGICIYQYQLTNQVYHYAGIRRWTTH